MTFTMPAAAREVRKGRLHRPESSLRPGPENQVELLVGHLLERRVRAKPCHCSRGRRAAESAHRVRDDPLDVGADTDVRGDREGLAALVRGSCRRCRSARLSRSSATTTRAPSHA
jgi:hypothetical protein